jgi:MtN3 and saliva related transmembrane protein
MTLEILATILGVITGLANVPQILKILKNKSAKDISITTNLIFITSSVVWLLYGLELSNFPLIIANIIYVITYGMIILGWLFYGRDDKKMQKIKKGKVGF